MIKPLAAGWSGPSARWSRGSDSAGEVERDDGHHEPGCVRGELPAGQVRHRGTFDVGVDLFDDRVVPWVWSAATAPQAPLRRPCATTNPGPNDDRKGGGDSVEPTPPRVTEPVALLLVPWTSLMLSAQASIPPTVAETFCPAFAP